MRPKNQETIEKIRESLDEYQRVNNCSPSTRELASMVGTDCGTVSRYLSYMEEQGLVERRGTRNLVTRSSKAKSETAFIPLVGAIACGSPILAEENIEEYLPMPISFARDKGYFFLRAKGDSMVNAGIDDGDLVLIRSSTTAHAGEIVVALIENEEATLKRYYKKQNSRFVTLQPENEDYAPITVDLTMQAFSIQGVAETVIKRL